jgi:hypothetical protein
MVNVEGELVEGRVRFDGVQGIGKLVVQAGVREHGVVSKPMCRHAGIAVG